MENSAPSPLVVCQSSKQQQKLTSFCAHQRGQKCYDNYLQLSALLCLPLPDKYVPVTLWKPHLIWLSLNWGTNGRLSNTLRVTTAVLFKDGEPLSSAITVNRISSELGRFPVVTIFPSLVSSIRKNALKFISGRMWYLIRPFCPCHERKTALCNFCLQDHAILVLPVL